MNAIEELKEFFAEIMRLNYIQATLGWDQEVNMQNYKSLEGRSKQVSLIEKLIHRRVTSEKVGSLIKEAEKLSNLNEIEKAMLREISREYDLATKLPEKLVADIAETSILASKTWREARSKSDFSIFVDILEKTIDLQRQKAERLEIHPDLYSTLIDLYEPGATYYWIAKFFNPIKPKLIEFVKKLNSSPNKPDDSILKKQYDPDKQYKLSNEIVKKMNFDFGYGRQDKVTHPFTTTLASMDTRITTRTTEPFPDCITSTIHECGHALYEMGIKKELHDTLLCSGTSFGIHESQSRLWENFVGRSKEFWIYWYPIFQKYFPDNLKNYPLEEFHHSVNMVQPSFIRVNADEVTYGLHIILRFEMEKDLLEGKTNVKELPEIWNTNFEELFGITPPNDAQGVLQDVHWSAGLIGYFPTYFLGNLYAAQIYNKILTENPNLPEDFKRGEYSNLLNFLREKIHQHGKIYGAPELIRRVTGEELNPDYFLNYIYDKYPPIYGI
ncbi:hypothetical protein LCGC14_0877230 [marine sediment metagenome]|uniref:Metal-dependent carboxypeptidase n=1 Tax=marine sediment metagenome TaxID=412755 RepID=A0A0F9S9Y5_9ZZZZ